MEDLATAERYRERAAQIRKIAEIMRPETRRALLEVAAGYEAMAGSLTRAAERFDRSEERALTASVSPPVK